MDQSDVELRFLASFTGASVLYINAQSHILLSDLEILGK